MIQVKSTEIKLRGSDKDLAIECSVLMRFIYQTNLNVFREVIASLIKEVDHGTTVQSGPEAD